MKIKCHLCKEEVEEPTVKGICEHFTDYHKWENILINEYAKLIFKIHEKIEKYSPPNPEQDPDSVELLKSLLENENEK